MTVYLNTTYREHGAGDLVTYIRRGDRSVADDVPLKNRAGRELSDSEIEGFIAKTERHNFERDIIISPENGADLSQRELERATRATMNEFTDGRPTASYVYAVHEDTEHPHVHVAVAGDKQDLYMDREDIMQTRDHANERFVEQHRERIRRRERDPLRAVALEVDRAREQDRDVGLGRGL